MPSSVVRHAAYRVARPRRLTAREIDRRAGTRHRWSTDGMSGRYPRGLRAPEASKGDPAPKVMPDCYAIYVV